MQGLGEQSKAPDGEENEAVQESNKDTLQSRAAESLPPHLLKRKESITGANSGAQTSKPSLQTAAAAGAKDKQQPQQGRSDQKPGQSQQRQQQHKPQAQKGAKGNANQKNELAPNRTDSKGGNTWRRGEKLRGGAGDEKSGSFKSVNDGPSGGQRPGPGEKGPGGGNQGNKRPSSDGGKQNKPNQQTNTSKTNTKSGPVTNPGTQKTNNSNTDDGDGETPRQGQKQNQSAIQGQNRKGTDGHGSSLRSAKLKKGKNQIVRTKSGNTEYFVEGDSKQPKTKGELQADGTVRLTKSKPQGSGGGGGNKSNNSKGNNNNTNPRGNNNNNNSSSNKKQQQQQQSSKAKPKAKPKPKARTTISTRLEIGKSDS